MNKRSIVERLCSDLIAKNRDIYGLLYFMFDRMPKIVGSRDLSHAHFQGKLFLRPLGIPDTKLHTKFEVSS